MSTLPSQLLDLQQLKAIAERHKKTLIWFPLATLLVGAVIFIFCPRTYRSEARIFLRVGRESVGLDPTATTGQTVALQQSDRKDEVKSAIEVLKSRSVIADAVDQLGADVVLGREKSSGGFSLISMATAPLRWCVSLVGSIDPVSAREQAVVRIERHLYVSAERESTLLVVQYDADSPQLAQKVCDAVVASYRQEHLRIFRNEESRPFFAGQQARLRGQLDESLDAVRKSKNELGITSVEQRRSTLEAQFNAVELDRLTTEQELATVQARLDDIKQQLGELPERLVASKKSVPNQGTDLLRQQLYALEMKTMDLEARYSESHPLVQAAKNQVDEAKRVVGQQSTERTETTDDINPIFRNLSLEMKQQQSVVAGYKARQSQLTQQKEAILIDLRSLNDRDLEIDKLSREADLARDKFFQYSRNMEEARIDKELENKKISNVSIVQPATLAEKPISPSKPVVAMSTLLLAIAGTLSLIFIAEQKIARLTSGHEHSNGNESRIYGNGVRNRIYRRVAHAKVNGESPSEETVPSTV